MNRREFLKKIGLGALAATAPVVHANGEGSKKTYKFDELFYQPYKTNSSLYYVKNGTFIAEEIYNEIVERPVDKKYTTGIYFPVRDVLIENKVEYTKEDFNGLLNYIRGREYKDMCRFIPYYNPVDKEPSPIRLLLMKNNYFTIEFLEKPNY